LVSSGSKKFDQELQKLYETGRANNWQSKKELIEIEERLVKQFADVTTN
jgi:hypothetical protein